MPKIYEHRGFRYLFYSNDHTDKIHCHVKKDGKEAKIVLSEIGGVYLPEIKPITNRRFKINEKEIIEDFCRLYAAKMVEKWNTFYIKKKKPKFEKVNKIKKSK